MLFAATNRWAVTGTPIQKSINDLKPLLKFIGFFNNKNESFANFMWSEMVQEFIANCQKKVDNGNFSRKVRDRKFDLIELLQKCLWRTSKSQVIDELPIPKPKEILHRIEFNRLERLFYNEQHAICQKKFMLNASKYNFGTNTANISAQNMRKVSQHSISGKPFTGRSLRFFLVRLIVSLPIYFRINLKSNLWSLSASLYVSPFAFFYSTTVLQEFLCHPISNFIQLFLKNK